MKIQIVAILVGLLSSIQPIHASDAIIVYSARMAHLIKPLFDAYTKKTGVSIKFISAKEEELLERLVIEGENTPADLLLTVDVGNLWLATEKQVLRPIDSATLEKNIPAHLRDPEKRWFGLSVRARPIMYNTEKIKPEELKDYADLANPKWQGKLCLRTAKKVYNQSLVAMFIARDGVEKTRAVLMGWVNNLALPVLSSDTQVIESIANGQCEVGIANTYYLGRLQHDNPNLPVAIHWHDGVHINISGAGVTKYAKHPDLAIQLLEWLSSMEAQDQFAELNFEYPANPQVKLSAIVEKWGSFTADTLHVSEAGRLQLEATHLMEQVGYR
ncbi:extracellular solute-binding protein [Beggiatoa leptomitoformis]|uniref:Extracellular solute-binding protein n=1 Tax=Beggiatoa leptomitoformis TaxID=288004 RepID=A0A2N9YE54_9GAMM|nr:extracellular solute-binding protein [Beggiatoa leptomitoformis]ALG68947.1 extracellular solute-binding protein [Beggiatoa leptomitoformis]AUI68665.1 extracellular solute-binding protein [Beggiatoa leptomitoformis]